MNQWKPIFTGMIGMRQVQIEAGDSGIFRVTTFQQGTEITIQVHGDTPGDLEQNLRDKGNFSSNEAQEIAHKLIYK